MHRHTIPMRIRLAGVAHGVPSAVVAPIAHEPERCDAKIVQQIAGTLARICDELDTRRQEIGDEVARASVELAIQITERLLMTEIAADRQRLDRMVEQALARVAAADNVVLR